MLKKIFPDDQEITEELIAFYEKNPEELDLIINKEYFHIGFLSFFFVLGLIITVLAGVLRFFFSSSLGMFINDVVLDIIYELGIAIFGGAVVALLIEFLNRRQYQQNINFRKKIKREIERRKGNKVVPKTE